MPFRGGCIKRAPGSDIALRFAGHQARAAETIEALGVRRLRLIAERRAVAAIEFGDLLEAEVFEQEPLADIERLWSPRSRPHPFRTYLLKRELLMKTAIPAKLFNLCD